MLTEGKDFNDKLKIIQSVKGKLQELSTHKFSSNVIEKCILQAREKDKTDFIDELVEKEIEISQQPNLKSSILYQMIQDKFGNYVIQKLLVACSQDQRELLNSRIKEFADQLKEQGSYSKHVFSFLDKLEGSNQDENSFYSQQ